MEIRLKRVYDEPEPGDGFRVLVDRLWPRGLTKERAAIELWAKEAAPSTQLRRAFHQDGMDWETFDAAYRGELARGPAVDDLRAAIAGKPVTTLLYGAQDAIRNHAEILREILLGEP
ncbi:DUF488 domain-containing protein [Microbacterium sp. SS28]|uniref:DUF488 domain-containing protein n=1 Tax=Microbacterium sp. SS28 TaxID=2919948 RepID=UPI001FA9BAB5|nr:DUF488 family protein [Microbacterium sp. SS28]